MSSGKPYSGNMEEIAVNIMSFGNRFFEHFLLPETKKRDNSSVTLDVDVSLLQTVTPGSGRDGILSPELYLKRQHCHPAYSG